MTILVSGDEGKKEKKKSSLFYTRLKKKITLRFWAVFWGSRSLKSWRRGVAWTQGQSDADRSAERYGEMESKTYSCDRRASIVS